MSCVFKVGDDDLWNPANTVGWLFKAEVEAVASVLELTSGLSDLIEDEYEIDLPVFEKFLTEIASRYHGATHPILKSLLTNVIGLASVLIERAGGHLPEASPEQMAEWEKQRQEYSRAMPR